MAHAMNIETGIDLDALIDVARFAQDALDRTLPGMVMKAGKASELARPDAPRMKRGLNEHAARATGKEGRPWD